MPRRTTSLARSEISRILQIPQAAVDALVDSGRLLCHVRGQEARVPLEELEAFFRDSLVRLYQTEAWLTREGAAEDPLATLDAPSAPVDDEPPAPVEEPSAPPVEEPPAPPLPPLTLPPPVTGEPEPESEDRDLRRAPRYIPRRQISGIFNETRFTIVQLSATGLRIRHKGTILPGDEAKLSFALISPARSVVVRARVVWTSLARGGGETFSISGLRITEHSERVQHAIDTLAASHDLEPERRVKERRTTLAGHAEALDGIADEDVAAVLGAVQKFAADPVEASRWYSRARFALSDENVRRQAPSRPRDREEVLGVWEYLERQVEIPKVVGVMAWLRKAKAV